MFIAVVVIAAFSLQAACLWKQACDAATLELKSVRVVVELIMTPLVGLVGAVSGFYFGEKSGSSNLNG